MFTSSLCTEITRDYRVIRCESARRLVGDGFESRPNPRYWSKTGATYYHAH